MSPLSLCLTRIAGNQNTNLSSPRTADAPALSFPALASSHLVSAIARLAPAGRTPRRSFCQAPHWQVKIAEKDKLKTAFTTPYGIFVFNRMPFGLKNAPATFQRIIDKFRMSLPNVLILAYLDDIIACSENFKSHLNDSMLTFETLEMIGFHLNRSKCFFLSTRSKIFGSHTNHEWFKT